MTYTAHRDERFEYVWDVMNFIEENQCQVCYFRKRPEEWGVGHAEEYPMCTDIEGPLSLEEPVNELDDRGAAGVVCSKFKLGDPPPPEDPGQLRLIELNETIYE